MRKPREVTEIVKRLRDISSKINSKADWTFEERRAIADEVRQIAKRVDTLDARKITEEERDPSKKGVKLP